MCSTWHFQTKRTRRSCSVLESYKKTPPMLLPCALSSHGSWGGGRDCAAGLQTGSVTCKCSSINRLSTQELPTAPLGSHSAHAPWCTLALLEFMALTHSQHSPEKAQVWKALQQLTVLLVQKMPWGKEKVFSARGPSA